MENLNQTSEEFTNRARRVANDVSQRARHYASDMNVRGREVFNRTNDWVRENRGPSIAILFGVIATFGLAGFFMSRRRQNSLDRF